MTRMTRCFLAMPIAVVLLGLIPAKSPAATTARIIASEPGLGATLGRQQPIWLQIGYDTDEPVQLWARPYRNGAPTKDFHSNASLYYFGTGTALGWFELVKAGEVDEIRIVAGGGNPFREWEVLREPVSLHWTDTPAAGAARPAWVDDLLAAEQARYTEDAQRRANAPVPATDVMLFSGFMLAVLGSLVIGIGVPFWSMWKWRGGWRLAAAVPASLLAFVILRIVVGTASDPTSHNLWPFEVLQFGAVSLAMIGGLTWLRRIRGVQS